MFLCCSSHTVDKILPIDPSDGPHPQRIVFAGINYLPSKQTAALNVRLPKPKTTRKRTHVSHSHTPSAIIASEATSHHTVGIPPRSIDLTQSNGM